MMSPKPYLLKGGYILRARHRNGMWADFGLSEEQKCEANNMPVSLDLTFGRMFSV